MRAFVTGSTGLLGNHLVRLLAAQGHHMKALARSREKASKLFGDLDVTIVQGDMLDVSRFAPELAGDTHGGRTRRRTSDAGGNSEGQERGALHRRWPLLRAGPLTGVLPIALGGHQSP
jgi:NAD(P)-dependent dehydrogenase (short-subunit alcohol dehydrogenase family)